VGGLPASPGGAHQPPSYNTWIRPIRCVGCDGQTLRLAAPDQTAQYWLIEYYAAAIRRAAETVRGHPIRLEITADADAAAEEDAA